MPHLLTLPTELLIEIFAANDTILDALHLSATNRYLNAIWLEHSELTIIERILRPSLPAYDEAVQLAILKSRLESSTNDPPSLQSCLPLLLRTGDLCASACLAYSIAQTEAISPPTSYYFLRRAGLGFIHYQLRDDLYSELRTMSREALLNPITLYRWLWDKASWELKVSQGVVIDDGSFEADALGDQETPWDYAFHVLSGALDDIDRGTNRLPVMMEGYDQWDNDVFFEHIVNPRIMM